MDQTSETEKIYQKTKFNEIIDILLEAGYFRARINTLSEFDKVVGGLCWCITSSGELVDVDILFQENSTIGQRIALSEAIVQALRKMGCPAPIQPHQIQGGVGGSDFPAIHQVIIWLIKKYFERRGEREQQLRAFSTFQFSKNYQLPFELNPGTVPEILEKIISRSKAVRIYKRNMLDGETSEETRVRSCLLEFGETFTNLGRGSEFEDYGDASASQSFLSTASSAVSNREDSSRPTASRSSSSGPLSQLNQQAAELSLKGGRTNQTGISGKAEAESIGELLGSSAETVASSLGEKRDPSSPLPPPPRAGGGKTGESATSTLAGLSKRDSAELSGFEKQLARAAREAQKEEEALAVQVSKEQTELMRDMAEIDAATATHLSGSVVGNIVGLGSSEIGSAQAAYQAQLADSRKEMDTSLASGKMGRAAAFNRQKQHLLKQCDELAAKQKELQIVSDSMEQKRKMLEEERAGAANYISKLKAQIKKFSDMQHNSSQQEDLMAVQQLITKLDTLKAEEAEFKATCKTKRKEYKEKIESIEELMKEDTPENKQIKEVEAMHAKIMSKYDRLRQMLAAVNLEVAQSVRAIDDTPTRIELIQYERRFGELYQQVAWKLEETRKYYDMYNTLETTLGFIQKEIKLLNSISDNFAEAMKSTASKIEFSKQFDNIVRGVEDSLIRQENNLKDIENRVEKSKTIHQELVDEQRKYFKAVKDFQDECNKNDWLSSKLEQLTRQ